MVVVIAVVTARRGTLPVVVRPLLFVLAAVIAAIIAAVIVVPLFRRSCCLVLSGAGALVGVRPYLDVLGFLK
jgi:hypothetical protein